MDIGFIWDEDKYKEVQRRHGVQFYEVVSAFYDLKWIRNRQPSGYEDRWMWIGKTVDNRVLAIIFFEEDLPLYRLITAFDAERRLVDKYYRRRAI